MGVEEVERMGRVSDEGCPLQGGALAEGGIAGAGAQIGAGSLNFKKIIAAAEQSGRRWFIVEQDHTPGDPFDSVRQSFDYIKANLVA